MLQAAKVIKNSNKKPGSPTRISYTYVVWDIKFLLEIATSKQIQKGKLKPLHQRRKKDLI